MTKRELEDSLGVGEKLYTHDSELWWPGEIGGGKHRKGRFGDDPMLSQVGLGRKQT